MEIVEADSVDWGRGRSPSRMRMYDEVADALSRGSFVKFTETDYEGGSRDVFRQRICAALRYRNIEVQTRTINGCLHVRAKGTE